MRATCATRLFQQGVDEQLICQQTGHRSLAVRSYKRPCDSQQKDLSSIIQHGPKRAHTSGAHTSSSTVSCPPVEVPVCRDSAAVGVSKSCTSVSASQPTSSTTISSGRKPLTFTFNFNFQ